MKFVKTDTGQQVMRDRSVPLAPRQRSAFILCDGKHTVEEVLAATSAMGVTLEDLQQMAQLGLLAPARDAVAEAASLKAKISHERNPQQRYQDAYPIATRLTAALGLRGFRLNLAVEAAGTYEQLRDLAPKIRDAVGSEKYTPLDEALNS